MVNNMYGNSVMDEVIIDDLNHAISDYLKEHNIKYFGEPLPVEGHIPEKYSISKPADVNFKLEFGLIPSINLVPLTKEDDFTFYKVNITEEMLEEEWKQILKRFAAKEDFKEGDAEIGQNDSFELFLQELEGDSIKENGVQSTASFTLEYMTDDAKALFLNQKIGFTQNVNVFQLEKEADRKTILKYVLDQKENEEKEVGDMFLAEIKSITKSTLPEENEELYNKIFPESGYTDKFQVFERMKEETANYYTHQAESYVKEKARKLLLQKNEFELPEAFLKRFFTTSIGENAASMTVGEFETKKDSLFKDMKWSLISSLLAKEEEIEIEEEDIKMDIAEDLSRYFGGNIPYEYVQTFYQNMKNNEPKRLDDIYLKLLNQEVLNVLFNKVSTTEEKISLDVWKEKVKALNQQVNE